jgi:hypothetical protein
MVKQVDAAVADVYEGIANIREILIFHNEYPLESVGWAGRLQSENSEIIATMKKLNG